MADYSSAWTELRGYVQEAVNDGEPINPMKLLAYMDELKRNILAPRLAWIRDMGRQHEAADGQTRGSDAP